MLFFSALFLFSTYCIFDCPKVFIYFFRFFVVHFIVVWYSFVLFRFRICLFTLVNKFYYFCLLPIMSLFFWVFLLFKYIHHNFFSLHHYFITNIWSWECVLVHRWDWQLFNVRRVSSTSENVITNSSIKCIDIPLTLILYSD